jgi:hypothetical protein
MRVEDMAAVTVDSAVAMADTAADMPRPAMLGADMLAMSKRDTLFAAGVATIMRAVRAETHAMQDAGITRLAAVTGEAAVIGEVITDIPGSAIMDRVTAIRTMGMALTVTALVGAMIRTTDIIPADTLLTGTGIRHT